MPIKIKFIIIGTFSLIVTLIVGFILFQNTKFVDKEIEKETIINDIQNNIFDQAIIRDDYILYHDERPVVQLQAVSNKLDSLFAQASEVFVSPDEQAQIALLVDNDKFIDQTLYQIINFSGSNTLLETQLTSQIIIKSQDNINIAKQLEDTSRTKVSKSQQGTVSFILMVIPSVFLIIMVSLYFTWYFIGVPLVALKEAALRIASLDFTAPTTTTTTTKPSNDEVGQLTGAFNVMASKLKESYEKIRLRTQDLQNANMAAQNVLEDLNSEKIKYEALISSIGDGIIATDDQTNIIVINPAAERILGLGKNEVIGKRLIEAFTVTDKEGKPLPASERPINKAILGMKSFSTSVDSEYYYARRDGTKIPVALDASPVIIDGQLTGVIDVFRDISHEKEVDRMKTEFVSLSSHQLRTPLTAIKWGLEAFTAADDGNLTDKQKDELNDINGSTLRMIDLVNSLLNVSRIESGRIIVNPIPTNIVKLANDVVGRLKIELANKEISLVMNVADNLPEINLDVSLISNVYQNLISNAISYSPQGTKITLSILEKDGNIISSIKDEGIGIPENEKMHIFEKFYRASNVKTVSPDGSGLGLYIVKSIIESSGGKLWFESEEGNGSTFYFSLPLMGMKAKEGEISLT